MLWSRVLLRDQSHSGTLVSLLVVGVKLTHYCIKVIHRCVSITDWGFRLWTLALGVVENAIEFRLDLSCSRFKFWVPEFVISKTSVLSWNKKILGFACTRRIFNRRFTLVCLLFSFWQFSVDSVRPYKCQIATRTYVVLLLLHFLPFQRKLSWDLDWWTFTFFCNLHHFRLLKKIDRFISGFFSFIRFRYFFHFLLLWTRKVICCWFWRGNLRYFSKSFLFFFMNAESGLVFTRWYSV